ncbi:unnamed protein product [Lepeophtheirus salmonis]|uniref:(salmon louse) hypothetical protein n=1 Tax=Lepeophtheirus salmonis TaxID=72036 RepID=A0A7R8D1M1_LEPSM|nr:unnamed protein product [Lepeophtheirus salmonis]CAF2992666.1 unnamed protein product [Lepeophtheirus salmonis]
MLELKTVNFMRARTLKHRRFVAFLEEKGSEHNDISYHTNVRWLSQGKVLKRVWDLRDLIQDYCGKKGRDIPELSDEDWVADLGYAVGVTALIKLTLLERIECQTVAQGPFCARDLQYCDGFHENVAASLKPSEGQHCNPLSNTKGNHKISTSSSQVLKQSEMHMVSSKFNCSVDNAPCNVQIELTSGRSLPVSLTAEILHITQRGELSTPEEAYSEDFEEKSEQMERDSDPFLFSEANRSKLPITDKEELLEVSSDRGLKLKLPKSTLTQFWVCAKQEYPDQGKRALGVPLWKKYFRRGTEKD